jgi:thiamine biosynthesis lipoprotein
MSANRPTATPHRAAAPRGAVLRMIGTEIRVLTTDADLLQPAEELVRARLSELDAAASRFRADSEVSRLITGEWCRISPLLADHLDAALRAARLTDGLVDPTVGAAVIASGYDGDLAAVRARPTPYPARRAEVPGWRRIERDVSGLRVRVPRGTVVDLGATAKAHAADRLARELAAGGSAGFLVDLGGDIAVAGDPPPDGWQIGIESAEGRVLQVVASTGQALATSSTRLRSWPTTTGTAHHVVDPRTGRTATAVHAQVTCAGVSALEANAASTASLVLGERAKQWLAERRIPGRLDRLDGRVERTPGWPVDDREARAR